MWRNVFGHAIYQMIVIIVIIFAWPQIGLVHPYDVLKLESGKYNPYYTKLHYVESEEIYFWGNLTTEGE
jgi:hypothetical protein